MSDSKDKPVKIGTGSTDSTSAQASLDKYEFEADQRKGK